MRHPPGGTAPLQIRQTSEYARWFEHLPDLRARSRILAGVRKLSLGQFGNAKALGEGLHEMRVDYGPGYRVYFVNRGGGILLLVSGGDKRRQKNDIARAREIAAAWEPGNGD